MGNNLNISNPFTFPIVSHSLSVGGSLMHSLGRLLDSSLVWYNTSSNRGQNATTRPRSDDSNSRNGRCRHRQHNGSLHTWGVDIENIREQILRQIFDLLSNLSWSSEALGFFAKVRTYISVVFFRLNIMYWQCKNIMYGVKVHWLVIIANY